MEDIKVPIRIAKEMLNSLSGGVVPRRGLGYIAVGRKKEIESLLKSIDLAQENISSIRIVCGNYGAGKTFLLQLMKEYALNKNFITADVDLSPERAFVGNKTSKKGLATYRMLMHNLAVKELPQGNALTYISKKWLETVKNQIIAVNDMNETDVNSVLFEEIRKMLQPLKKYVQGSIFYDVFYEFLVAVNFEKDDFVDNYLKWLCGDYRIMREAYNDINMQTIIDDENWFDYLKLWAATFKIMNYDGFLVIIDELANIYKMSLPVSRDRNYDKILSIYNDVMQSRCDNLCVFLASTPEGVYDESKGLFSYEALKSRLSTNTGSITQNMMSPIIHIHQLNNADVYLLLEKITQIFNVVNKSNIQFLVEDYNVFSLYVNSAKKYATVTPRTLIRDFIEILTIKINTPELSMKEILKLFTFKSDSNI